MISVVEARDRILAELAPLPWETVALSAGHGRVLARDAAARVMQPPAAVSAMDGYAVRAVDVAAVPARLKLVGMSRAGEAFAGRLGPGQAVRIFTGAVLPEGADAVVIQEDTEAEGQQPGAIVSVREAAARGRHVREAGFDFQVGQVGIAAGRALTARDIGLAAAMNLPWLEVRRRPRIGVLATGDEIVRPGEPIGPSQIVSSNALALAALIRGSGGETVDLGIARDRVASVAEHAAGARGCDLLVTLGGASVGEHDLVREALAPRGLKLDFWQVAMRPGKPLMFGRVGDIPLLGFPGNPVASLVCGLLFLRPALFRLQGCEGGLPDFRPALLGRDLPANDRREDYMRASAAWRADGQWEVSPFERQDSSNLLRLARADALVVRAPHAPALTAGRPVQALALSGTLGGF
ncbi:MAG: molybdopterin molybdotransferase MoeA [Alphaproteobacteria bacterium]|nr:molybdopterin molybdotransferase MoeA [Alphaproteobacteria bacterium]